VRTTHIGRFGAHGAPYLIPSILEVNTAFPIYLAQIEHNKGTQQRQRLFCINLKEYRVQLFACTINRLIRLKGIG
jgi:hypothetical protein